MTGVPETPLPDWAERWVRGRCGCGARLVLVASWGNDRVNVERVNDVLELDDQTLIKGRTREAAFRQHINERLAAQ